MFRKIRDFFAGDKPLDSSLETDQSGGVIDQDLHIAAAVLLVEMASSDKTIAPEEGRAVVAAMSKSFDIPEDQIPELVNIAIEARKEAGRIDEFVNCINERLHEAQRERILAMLWKVIIADGEIDKYEQRLATQMRFRFKLNEEQARNARQMAERGLV